MSIFISKGDQPLGIRQATSRGYKIMVSELAKAGARPGDEKVFASTIHEDLPARLVEVLAQLPGSPSTYAEYAAHWETSNETNSANNLFNHQLEAYTRYSARLDKYRLVEGRAEVVEQVDTGAFDDDGQPVTKSVVVSRAVAALPAKIEAPVYDETTGEQTGTELVDNPDVVADEAERAKAAYVVSTIPQDVIDFYNENLAA